MGLGEFLVDMIYTAFLQVLDRWIKHVLYQQLRADPNCTTQNLVDLKHLKQPIFSDFFQYHKSLQRIFRTPSCHGVCSGGVHADGRHAGGSLVFVGKSHRSLNG